MDKTKNKKDDKRVSKTKASAESSNAAVVARKTQNSVKKPAKTSHNSEKNEKTCEKAKTATIVLSSFLGLVLALFLVAYGLIGSYFFKFALDATFAAVNNAPGDMVIDMPKPNEQKKWFIDISKTERVINSDGYLLKAYQILADTPTHNWIITVHGYRGQASEMSDYAYNFHNKGFNVLMPDLKGHGQSEGKYIGMGYFDRLDIIKWIELILQTDSEAKIILHGVSMGAATIMMTTGEELPSNVVAAVEDCGYSDASEQFKHIVKNVLRLPFSSMILSAADTACKVKMGIGLKTISAVDKLKTSKTPTLFIHGDKDDFVPYSMLDKLYNANDSLVKQKLVIKGATHACAATVDPELYYKTVFDFIEKFI